MQGDSKATLEGTPQGMTPQKGTLKPPGGKTLNHMHSLGPPKQFASPQSREEALRPPCPHQGPVGGTPRSTPGKAASPSGMPPPRTSPGPHRDTHMSLAGRFLPSTMRMERALRRAMAGGQRSRAEPSGAKRRRARPRTRGPEHSAHVRAGAGGRQSACGGGEKGVA